MYSDDNEFRSEMPNTEGVSDSTYHYGPTGSASAPEGNYGASASDSGASAQGGSYSAPNSAQGGYTAPNSGYNGYGSSANAPHSTYDAYNSGSGYSSYTTAPNTPPTPPQKPKKEKKPWKWTASRVIALCLVCALLGGCISGGSFALLSRKNSGSSASGNTTTSTVLSSDRVATTNVATQKVAAGEKMSVADIYAAYSNSVVCIEVSTSSGTGAGTGFVITDDGYIVTCYHVIDSATDIAVTFPDQTSYSATLVGGDEDQDIAVLKIDATGLTPVVLGDSADVEVGDTVTAIGNALGTLANTTTTGIVSALDRALTMSDGSVINVMQTDCTVNSGNSGGPLFNEYGEVIGIVNAKYSNSSSYSTTASIEGIGFAIPMADVSSKITDLMEYGYITGKPYLGISVATVSALQAQMYNMVVGAYVNSINEGSCAETAGLQVGDIITAVDGNAITTYEELVAAKNTHSAGDEMVLTVNRDGEELTITVILDEEVPTTADSDSSTQSSGDSTQGYSADGNNNSNGSGMSPEDFYNYFFGNNGNGYGYSFGGGNSNGSNGGTW